MPKSKPGGASAPNYAKFVEIAREAGCDEDESAFDAKLRQIAKHKPKSADEAEAKNDKAPE